MPKFKPETQAAIAGNNPVAAETIYLAQCIEEKKKLKFYLATPRSDGIAEMYEGILFGLGVYNYLVLDDTVGEVVLNKAWVSEILPAKPAKA